MKTLREIAKELPEAVEKRMTGRVEADIWIRLGEINDTVEELNAQIEELEFNEKRKIPKQ